MADAAFTRRAMLRAIPAVALTVPIATADGTAAEDFLRPVPDLLSAVAAAMGRQHGGTWDVHVDIPAGLVAMSRRSSDAAYSRRAVSEIDAAIATHAVAHAAQDYDEEDRCWRALMSATPRCMEEHRARAAYLLGFMDLDSGFDIEFVEMLLRSSLGSV